MQHPSNMPLDPEKLQKPFRKLRKSLKDLSRRPSLEEVHDVRTRSRQLDLDVACSRAFAPISKRAGKVRDIDVLTGFAAGSTTG
jgi:CHAD domain-containing protein